METETSYQRIGREQRERQDARAKKRAAIVAAEQRAIRAANKAAKAGRRERAYLDVLTSDHNHEMDS